MPGNVLVTFEYGSINGGENSLLAVVDGLSQSGWCFSALVPPNTELAQLLRAKFIPTHPLHLTDQRTGTRLPQTEIRQQVATCIRETSPSLVHANSLSMSRLCGPVCRELGIPSLGYLRDIIKISRKAMDDINQCDCIVAVSEATRNFHLQRGLSAERSLTIVNGIDSAAFLDDDVSDADSADRQSIKAELGLPSDAQVILFVGQIGMRKGVDTLLTAFLEIAAQRKPSQPETHLLIVGQRHSQKEEAIEYEASLHRTGEESIYSDRILWLGRRTDTARLMQQSTLLIHPARQEPLGRVILEAAAVGLPIVATNAGGTSEILCEPELTPFLAPPDNAAALVAIVLTLLDDSELRQKTSVMLQQVIKSHFSIAACAKRLNDCYSRLSGSIA